MSQIKLNSIIGVDKMAVEQLTREYKANRLFWKGYKAIVNSLRGHVTPNLRPNFDRVIHNIAEYKAKMLAIRVQIKNRVKPAIERMQSVQRPAVAPAAPAVDQNMVNEIRRQLDANPQLKAQVQALLLMLALQSGQPQQ